MYTINVYIEDIGLTRQYLAVEDERDNSANIIDPNFNIKYSGNVKTKTNIKNISNIIGMYETYNNC